MAKNSFNDMIVRAMQKRDASRVALKKSSCGAVMIDGLTFSVSAESDGAASSKGVMFTLSVYAGDGMRESSLFNQLDLQTLTFFLIGTAASLAGMAIGHAFLADEKSRQKSE